MKSVCYPIDFGSVTRVPAVLALFAMLLSGCGSSAPHKIQDEEFSPAANGKSYQDLLVFAVYDDRPYRVASETQFVEELKEHGVTAASSFNLVSDLHSLESNEAVVELLATTDHDAILVVATLDEGYDYDLGDYYETQGWVYLLGGRPGAGTDLGAFVAWAGSGQYSLYVGLWDVNTQKPVWQISTLSSTTGSESGDTSALADFVVEQLRTKNLIATNV